METLMYAAIGLAIANSVILMGLMYLYARIARKTHASYSFALAIFGGLLLLHNLLTIYAYGSMSPLFGVEALPYLAGMGALELAGLLVLLKVTI